MITGKTNSNSSGIKINGLTKTKVASELLQIGDLVESDNIITSSFSDDLITSETILDNKLQGNYYSICEVNDNTVLITFGDKSDDMKLYGMVLKFENGTLVKSNPILLCNGSGSGYYHNGNKINDNTVVLFYNDTAGSSKIYAMILEITNLYITIKNDLLIVDSYVPLYRCSFSQLNYDKFLLTYYYYDFYTVVIQFTSNGVTIGNTENPKVNSSDGDVVRKCVKFTTELAVILFNSGKYLYGRVIKVEGVTLTLGNYNNFINTSYSNFELDCCPLTEKNIFCSYNYNGYYNRIIIKYNNSDNVEMDDNESSSGQYNFKCINYRDRVIMMYYSNSGNKYLRLDDFKKNSISIVSSGINITTYNKFFIFNKNFYIVCYVTSDNPYSLYAKYKVMKVKKSTFNIDGVAVSNAGANQNIKIVTQ